MPKAKFKTKGTIKENIENSNTDCNLSNDNDQTFSTPEINLTNISSDSDMTEIIQYNEIKLSGKINKSKQLQEKKTKRLKRRTLLPPFKLPTFDSDDDKPLSYTRDVHQTKCIPSSDTTVCRSCDDLVNTDNNPPTENKEIKNVEIVTPLENLNETPEEVAYTSVIKSASVLLIKKQNISNVDCPLPAKKRKLKFSISDLINAHSYIESDSENSGSKNDLTEETATITELNKDVVDSTVDKNVENNDSDNTETYSYKSFSASPAAAVVSNGRPFSPIPSTSKDTVVFEKNDQRFQESLKIDDDVVIIETPVETIIIGDESPHYDLREIIDITNTDKNDEDVEFIGYANIPNLDNAEVDKILDLYENRYHKEPVNTSDCMIVDDYDGIIAKGNAILQKLRRKKVKSPVNVVPPQLDEPTSNADPLPESIDLSSGIGNDFMDYLTDWFATPTVPLDPVIDARSAVNDNRNNQHPNINAVDTACNNNRTHIQPNDVQTCRSLLEFWHKMPEELARAHHGVIRNPAPNQANQANTSNAPNVIQPHIEELRRNVENTTWMDYNIEHTLNPNSWRSEITPPVAIQEPSMDAPVDSARQVSQSPFGKNMECPICMESLASKPLASTICGHIFCMACIQQVLKVAGPKRCPTCRKTFKKGQSYHPLFI